MSGLGVLDQIDAYLNPKKVGIVEFAEQYCGKKLYIGQRVILKLMFLEDLDEQEDKILDYWIAGGRNGTEIAISPKIREKINFLKEAGFKHFREVVLVGGRRSSKGYITGIAMAKIAYDTLQLQDPGEYFGIDPDKNIHFSAVAASEQQARETQFGDLQATIEACEEFGQYGPIKSLENEVRIPTAADQLKLVKAKRKKQKIDRTIATLRAKALAANASTVRGTASMAIAIDEMAWLVAGESRQGADQIYDAIKPSLDQFGRAAMVFCNSSPYTKVGKFHERYVAGMELDKKTGMPTDPYTLVFQFPSWALYEHYREDKAHKWTKVPQVSPDWDENQLNPDGSYYHSDEVRHNIPIQRNEEAANPDKYKVERRGRFAEVIDAYLQPEMVDRAYEGRPVRRGSDIKRIKFGVNWLDSRNVYKYRAHLDPSSTTAGFGFALGHTEYFGDDEIPHVVFDILHRWEPKKMPNGVIWWPTVKEDVLKWADIFRPYEITFDQYQSHEPIQSLQIEMRQRGMGEVRVYEKVASNESNWNRAEVFKTALYQDLIHAPSNTPEALYSAEELKFLQQKNSNGRYPRVDKQDIGPVQTKDIADCMMEVVYALIGNTVMSRFREGIFDNMIIPGAQGGYPLGGMDRGGKGTIKGSPYADQFSTRAGDQRLPASVSRRKTPFSVTRGIRRQGRNMGY